MAIAAIVIQPNARGTVDSHNWSWRLVEKPVWLPIKLGGATLAACLPIALGAFRLPRARVWWRPHAGLVGGAALKHNSDRRFESFAGDLNLRRGIVSGEWPCCPRSSEFSPMSHRFVPPPSRARRGNLRGTLEPARIVPSTGRPWGQEEGGGSWQRPPSQAGPTAPEAGRALATAPRKAEALP
ncbi:hypothetical protein H6P81_021716 [Aristolochia fimbriata]|uniref:Uncharacterized protein n=1 Tax=Aristolochia fimbriata TaxID=158543 RepID=A0AAV7DQ56_ARIFI|nr:hypothetical protein H6P81_021716 [Aristolochia fimbriata]